MADNLFGFDSSNISAGAKSFYQWWASYEKVGPVELYENRVKRRAKPHLNNPTASPKKIAQKKVKAENLSGEIVNAVLDYVITLESATEEQLLQIASETVEELKAISPVYTGKSKKIKKGKYRKGWKSTSKMTATGLKVIIHNSSAPNLTWLLEDQHLNRDGTTYSMPIPHISIAHKHAEEKVDKLLEGL